MGKGSDESGKYKTSVFGAYIFLEIIEKKLSEKKFPKIIATVYILVYECVTVPPHWVVSLLLFLIFNK